MKLSVSSKLFACDTVFNLKQEDFHMLPCNVSVRNFGCNCDKPTVKYVRKSICGSNFCSSKLVYASSVRPSKPSHGSNVCLSKPITSSIARPSKLVSGSNVRSVNPISVLSFLVNKLVVVMFVQLKPLVLLMLMQVNPYMAVMFV